MSALEQLKARLNDVAYLNSAAKLLAWDQEVNMPEGGAASRGMSLATLARMSHELFTAPETGTLLRDASVELSSAGYDSDDVALVRIAQYDYDRLIRIPAELVTEINRISSLAHVDWVRARAQNQYELFAPWLEKIVELQRQYARYIGYKDRMYDALISDFEPGMTTSDVATIFEDLKQQLVPMIALIRERQDRASDDVQRRFFDVDKQRDFALRIAKMYGFDFHRGRQDRSVHPFCESMSPDDVRLTTRFDENFLQVALMGLMHETGHGLYEQGVSQKLHPYLAEGTSLGVHESQSRLWENIVGRSREFWSYAYPMLQSTFPESLGDVPLEAFYRAINTSKPSLIRVEADEVTYNMHTLLRFEIENELLEGTLSVKDAPTAWNDKMQQYLGIVPPTDSLGILQDVHWSHGTMGYFPTYTIGNLLSAQLYQTAIAAQPDITTELGEGKFDLLLGWLRENVHQHGRKYLPTELVERVTGTPLSSKAYVQYLRTKYGEIYGF